MNWMKIAGGLGFAVMAMLTSKMWTRVHDLQARHMQDYGDKERNKYGLWK